MVSWRSSRMAKMKENLTKSCLSVALAMVYLNSVWAPAMAVTDPGDGMGWRHVFVEWVRSLLGGMVGYPLRRKQNQSDILVLSQERSYRRNSSRNRITISSSESVLSPSHGSNLLVGMSVFHIIGPGSKPIGLVVSEFVVLHGLVLLGRNSQAGNVVPTNRAHPKHLRQSLKMQ